MTAQNFEQAMTDLETLVKKLEGGSLSLNEALETFEKGTVLRKFCEDSLAQAKLKVDQIVQSTSGVSAEPLDPVVNS